MRRPDVKTPPVGIGGAGEAGEAGNLKADHTAHGRSISQPDADSIRKQAISQIGGV